MSEVLIAQWPTDGWSGSEVPAGVAMKRFEYKAVGQIEDGAKITETLNYWGELGWELVCVGQWNSRYKEVLYTFKREIP